MFGNLFFVYNQLINFSSCISSGYKINAHNIIMIVHNQCDKYFVFVFISTHYIGFLCYAAIVCICVCMYVLTLVFNWLSDWLNENNSKRWKKNKIFADNLCEGTQIQWTSLEHYWLLNHKQTQKKEKKNSRKKLNQQQQLTSSIVELNCTETLISPTQNTHTQARVLTLFGINPLSNDFIAVFFLMLLLFWINLVQNNENNNAKLVFFNSMLWHKQRGSSSGIDIGVIII